MSDEALQTLLARSYRLLEQKRNDRNKLYSVHEPDVRCIAKGKAHKRYEFGAKASFVTSSKGNWLLSAQSLMGNPYDGHTLEGALEQTESLTGITPEFAYCDQGYRGHRLKGPAQVRIVGKIPKRAKASVRRWMKRRAAIEPTIGHLKADHRLGRNHLKGNEGDQANVVLAAAAYNLAKLLAWFYCARKIGGLIRLLPRMTFENHALRPVYA